MKRAACLSLIAFASVAGSADAATTIGQTTGTMDNGVPITIFQTALPGVVTTVPGPGVLTSWSYQASSQPAEVGPVELKVGRPAGGNNLTIVAESDRVTPAGPSTTLTLPIRIPVQTGDLIGLYVPEGANFGVSGDPGSTVLRIVDGVDRGAGHTSLYEAPGSDIVVDLSAVHEPDADSDGFGDETQDACPGSAGPTGGCDLTDRTAPETTLTEQPKRKTGKRKARFAFTASEAGSTFECSLDGKPFALCSSPTKTMRLKRRKHRFEVRAIDTAGNVDATPALAKFKVKKKPTK